MAVPSGSRPESKSYKTSMASKNSWACRLVLGCGILKMTSFLYWPDSIMPPLEQTPNILPSSLQICASFSSLSSWTSSTALVKPWSLPSSLLHSQQPKVSRPHIVATSI